MTTMINTQRAHDAIDLCSCKMDDVIGRSILLHPSRLADAMVHVSSIHEQAGRTLRYRDTEAGRIAADMADDAALAAQAVREGDCAAFAFLADARFGQRVMLFAAACKLQCIPQNVAQSIAAREG